MPTTDLLNEKELLFLVAEGDEIAYKKIFTHYYSGVFATSLRFTKSREISQDLTQDVFARIWIKKEKLKEIDNFEAFLFITARNMILDSLRKKVFIKENEDSLIEYFEEEESLSPDYRLEFKEMNEIIHRGITLLPERQQRAFYLSRLAGLKHKDIALEMGISQESVKSHIVRAICQLRKYVTEHSVLLQVVIFFRLLS